MNDVRMISFCVLFFFGFAFIIGFLPSELYSSTYQYDREFPDFYAGLDIAGDYAYTANFTVNDGTFTSSTLILGYREYLFDLGGQNWVVYVDEGYTHLKFGERNYLGIFWISTDFLTFKYETGADRGDILAYAEMNGDFVGNEGWLKYRMIHPRDPAIGCDVLIGFNTSRYASPQDALANEGLRVVVGIGFDDVSTTLNVWQLIGSIMLFQAPMIHPLLNAPIAFTLWIVFVFGLAMFIARFIPFLQGGA